MFYKFNGMSGVPGKQWQLLMDGLSWLKENENNLLLPSARKRPSVSQVHKHTVYACMNQPHSPQFPSGPAQEH